MNRIFGFFKQKIIEVKQQNKQQLQILANALTQNQYSTDRVLTILQSMKANYMNWSVLIANQASTGLYYSQLHNRNICLKKIKGNKQLVKHAQKNRMKLQFIQDTAKELKQINQLNGKWMNQVNAQLQGINQYLKFQKRKIQQKYSQNLSMENLKQVRLQEQNGGDLDKPILKQAQKHVDDEQIVHKNVQNKQTEAQIKVVQIQDDQQ